MLSLSSCFRLLGVCSLVVLAACSGSSDRKSNDSESLAECDESGGCITGYACNVERRCVAVGDCISAGGMVGSTGACERCGDAVVNGNEACDLGANNDGRYSGCTAACELGPRCGDGVVNGTEVCDGGESNSDAWSVAGACKTDCSGLAAHCGDGSADTLAACDDGISCTVEACDAARGCVHTPDYGACNDNIACTVDVCDVARGCVHTANALSCNDGDVCTADSCVTGSGCRYALNAGVCSHLAFGVAPTASQPQGHAWPAFTVRIEDASNAVVTSANGVVSLRLKTGTGTLSGTLSVRAVSGVATFDNVAYDLAENIQVEVVSGALEALGASVGLTVNLCGDIATNLAKISTQLDANYRAKIDDPYDTTVAIMAPVINAIKSSWSCDTNNGGVYVINEVSVKQALKSVFDRFGTTVGNLFVNSFPADDSGFVAFQKLFTSAVSSLSAADRSLCNQMLAHCVLMPELVAPPTPSAASNAFIVRVQNLSSVVP